MSAAGSLPNCIRLISLNNKSKQRQRKLILIHVKICILEMENFPFSRIHGILVSTYHIIAYNENFHQFIKVKRVKEKPSDQNIIKLDVGSESRDKK